MFDFLPAAAGVVGSGRFTVRPVKVSGLLVDTLAVPLKIAARLLFQVGAPPTLWGV